MADRGTNGSRSGATPIVRACSICGKETVHQFRPFCSRRCADVDLNRWLSNVYAIPVKSDEDEDGTNPAGELLDAEREPEGR